MTWIDKEAAMPKDRKEKRAKQKKKHLKQLMAQPETHELIAELAYYRAQARNFQCNCCERDWLKAEKEIKKMLAALQD